jgi:hypothetical protein
MPVVKAAAKHESMEATEIITSAFSVSEKKLNEEISLDCIGLAKDLINAAAFHLNRASLQRTLAK